MRKSRRLSGRVWYFECLENRVLLAGNVTATLVGTTLTLTGDASANNIQVSQLSNGNWQVKGIGTKVNNGSSAPTYPGVTDISADLMAGKDIIKVSNGTLTGDLDIEFSAGGNKTVQVSNINAADITVDTGAGNDSITVAKCTTTTNLEVDAEGGTNTVTMTDCHAGNFLAVEGGNQTNVLYVSGSSANTIDVSSFSRTGSETVSNCQSVADMEFDVENSTDGKRANNALLLTNLNVGGDLDSSYTDGTTILTLNHVRTGGDLDLNYAGTPVGQRVIVSISDAQSIGDFSLGTSADNTIVTLNRITADSVQLFPGNAVLSINDMTTLSGAYISAGGTVVITNSHFNVNGTAINTPLLIQSATHVVISNVTVVGAAEIDTTDLTDNVAINHLTADDITIDLGMGKYDVLSIVNSSATVADFEGGGQSGDTLIKAHNQFGTETHTGFQHVIG